MKLKRAAVYSAGLAALAAWWVSASTALLPPTPVPDQPQRTAIERQGALLADEISRLRELTRLVTEPQRPARDLFRFAAPAPSDPGGPPSEAQAFVSQAPPVAPPSPDLALIGLAQDEGPEGTVRTAIISGAGNLFIVKKGDPVTSRFRVLRISEEVVELVDTDGIVLRLPLE